MSFTIDHGEEFEEESGDENRRTNMEGGVETRRTTAEQQQKTSDRGIAILHVLCHKIHSNFVVFTP